MSKIFPDNYQGPEEPSGDPNIWRYIDFTQFVSIIEMNRLWFSRVAGFFDGYEGALPKQKLNKVADDLDFSSKEVIKKSLRFA